MEPATEIFHAYVHIGNLPPYLIVLEATSKDLRTYKTRYKLLVLYHLWGRHRIVVSLNDCDIHFQLLT